MIRDLKLNDGRSILEASESSNLLFVFVRHRGCTFCREALSSLSIHKEKLRSLGYEVFVVHMGDKKSSHLMQEDFGLKDLEFISDPKRSYYKAFGARRASLTEALGPKVIFKGLFGGKLKKYGVGKLEGDGFQLGGVFTLVKSKLKFVHDPCDASDVEDWPALIKAQAL